MSIISEFIKLLVRQLVSPINFMIAFLIGCTINYSVGVGIFDEWIPYLIPIIIQAISKTTVNFSNRKNKLLLQLPAKRKDPAFIIDYNGEVLAAMGNTKKLFDQFRIKHLSEIFTPEGAETLLSACVDNHELYEYSCEQYAPLLKNWYRVQLSKDHEFDCILVWTRNINEQAKFRDNLLAIRSFGNRLLDHIHEIGAKNDGLERASVFILEQGFKGVVIAEETGYNKLIGRVYKQMGKGICTSNLIEIPKESNAPILDSIKSSSVAFAERSSETDFDNKHPFNKQVRDFLDFKIENFINYYEGGVSVIAFNKPGKISDPDLVLMENLINKVRTLNVLIEANNNLKASEKKLELKVQEILEKEQKMSNLNHELNKFFYTTSHDLKTPVVNIQQLLSLIVLEGGAISKDYNRMLDNELNKMTRMLDMLTLVSSLDDSTTSKQAFDIKLVIKDILDELDKEIDLQTFDLLLSIEVETHIVGVRRLVKMIIKELIFNAWVFKDQSKLERWAKFTISEKNGQCIIQLEDNGIGMEESIKAQALDLFYRGSSQSLGAGLGLFAINKVVQFLNGELNVKSEDGIGTKICISIPTPHSTTDE